MNALKKKQSKRLKRSEGWGNRSFRLSGQKRPKEISGTMPRAGGSGSEQTRSNSCPQGVFNLEMKTKIKLLPE